MIHLKVCPFRFLCAAAFASAVSTAQATEIESLTLPEPVRVVAVSTSAELFSAVQSAEPGDHIELEGGRTYVGEVRFQRHGTAENPVVVRTAGEPLTPEDAATLTGAVHVDADHIWLYRIHVDNAPVRANRDYAVFLRSWFIGFPGAIIQAQNGSSFGRVEYCHIEGLPPGQAQPSTANRGVQGHGSAVNKDWILRRTLFRNIRRPSSGQTYLGGAFGMGHDWQEGQLDYGWIVEYCWFDNIETDQTTTIKGSGITLRHSVFDNVNFISNRNGTGNRFHGLLLRNSGGMWINDDGQEILGVVMEGSGQINLLAGTWDKDVSQTYGAHYAARNTVIAGCVANIRVGMVFSGWSDVIPARNNRIEGSRLRDGTPITSPDQITLTQHQEDTVVAAETDREIPQTVELTELDVGPNADLTDIDFAITTRLEAKANTVLIEGSGETHGGGTLFAGKFADPDGAVRRSLVRFKLPSSMPANARIDEAVLSVQVFSRGSETGAEPVDVSVHRVLAPWSEAEATWFRRDAPERPWGSEGGDFQGAPSDSVSMTEAFGASGDLEWSGPGLAADVQCWVARPEENHGWIILADEDNAGREIGMRDRVWRSELLRPSLTLTYGLASLPEHGPWKAATLEGNVYDDTLGLGWINILHAPWIYADKLAAWLYIDAEFDGWVYAPALTAD